MNSFFLPVLCTYACLMFILKVYTDDIFTESFKTETRSLFKVTQFINIS